MEVNGHGVELDSLGGIETRGRRTDQNQIVIDRRTHRSAGRHPLQKWWSNNISLLIVHSHALPNDHNNDPRDYLALERTFLAHIRTASALASFGVSLVQLFRLHNVDSEAGIILGSCTAGGGMVIVLVACRRYFRQQQKLIHGRAVAGGVEIWIDCSVVVAITVAVLVVVLAAD